MSNDREFYVVWNPLAGPPTYQHATYDGAMAEAKRLAERAKGDAFFVLRAVSFAKVREPVEVVTLLSDDDVSF